MAWFGRRRGRHHRRPGLTDPAATATTLPSHRHAVTPPAAPVLLAPAGVDADTVPIVRVAAAERPGERSGAHRVRDIAQARRPAWSDTQTLRAVRR